jgi:hypothetical protein
MTGIYFRVERGDTWEAVELENLTNEERETLLSDRPKEYVLALLHATCAHIQRLIPMLDDLVQDGIIALTSSEAEPSEPEPPAESRLIVPEKQQ